jgi:putative transposase
VLKSWIGISDAKSAEAKGDPPRETMPQEVGDFSLHVHCTSTHSSWLNQVERWFGLITQRATRRGSFRSVTELVQKIDDFVQHYNRKHRPFVWTATADSILQKIARLCSRISRTRH